MSVPNALDTLTSGLASICRIQNGVEVSMDAVPSDLPRLVALYDVENDAACRKVRERITELDLVVERIIPSAENSRVFKDETYEFYLSPSESIPQMQVKEASGDEKSLVGENDIVSFLNKNFAKSMVEASTSGADVEEQAFEVLGELGNAAAGALRYSRGSTVCSAALSTTTQTVPRPEKPLILYSYEGNQFCRLVREVLTELDFSYELRCVGKGSARREELSRLTGGSTQCPFLVDPNNDTKMPESADIIRYLYKHYALWTPPNELLEIASNVVLPFLKPLFTAIAPLQAGSYREDKDSYEADIAMAKSQIERDVAGEAVVVYTYGLSPFSAETKNLLDNIGISYKEISLGSEWLPGLISDPVKRAALHEMTGQSSLPHVFIGGKSIGGLFSGEPGLVPALEQGTLQKMIESAERDTVGSFE